MIPVRLAVRNFMCYQQDVPVLDFAGIHLACLSGDNGHGKSALIDAMTWAVWGETRARSDDDLVYTGQNEMEVQFDFAVAGQVYRVIRKHDRPRRPGQPGHTLLEFQVANGAGFRSLSGESKAQTQQKIIDVLHMEYDTFVNSAYLRQGHADEFTRQPPARRKEVLASILGFAVYDALEEQAREQARAQAADKQLRESEIRTISEELARKPDCEAALAQAHVEAERVEVAVKEKEAALNDQRQKRESLEQQKAQLEQLQAHLRDMEVQLKLWEGQAKQHQARIREYEAVLAKKTEIADGYNRLVEARKQAEVLERKARQAASLDQQKHRLELAIERAKNEVVREHDQARARIRDLEARTGKLTTIKDQLRQVEGFGRQLAEREALLAQKKQSLQGLQETVTQLSSSIAHLQHEIEQTSEKLTMLAGRQETKCPLCEQELGADGLHLIESKYAAERGTRTDALKAARAELATRKEQLRTLSSETAQLESRLNQERSTFSSRTAVLKKEITEAEEAAKTVEEERASLAAVEERLNTRAYATTEQAALALLEAELASLGYSSEAHDLARGKLRELEPYETSHRRLDEAERLLGQEKEAEGAARGAAAKLQAGLDSDNERCQSLLSQLSRLPAVIAEFSRIEAEFKALSASQAQAQEAVWNARNSLARCAELEIKLKEKQAGFAQAARQEDIYRELAEAFGKKGIQALLIETVLPEIENDANRLLGRMTDNRMTVRFGTQRETKKGSVVETLDINIADELGTRSYEMFSGGEAFRINFAIRIALSRLLARRAGAPLPTLIIDEGFGTQDVAGVEKLREAIISIQDDFEKILVITHIEDLRDAFPTRIEVTKTANGSTFTVS